MSTNSIFNDKKIKKSLLNLRYLAIMFLVAVVVLGFGFTTYYGYRFYIDEVMKLSGIILWESIFYVTTIMIIWGIYDVLKLLKNLENGNVFTMENADILKSIDKKLVFTFFFSLIANIIMVFIDLHSIYLLAIWIVFTSFVLAGHILVNPLSLLVEKSAEMRLEMDLTI